MNVEGTQLADAIVNRAVKGIASDVVRLAWGGEGLLLVMMHLMDG